MAYTGPSSGVLNVIPVVVGAYTPAPPTVDIGGDGDYALDLNTNTLYGPKDSTQANPWPVGTRLGLNFLWQGTWSATVSYNVNDVVQDGYGQVFLCVKPYQGLTGSVLSNPSSSTYSAGDVYKLSGSNGFYYCKSTTTIPPSPDGFWVNPAAQDVYWGEYTVAYDASSSRGNLGSFRQMDSTVSFSTAGSVGSSVNFTVRPSSITSTQLAAGAVESAKIAAGAVDSTALATNAVQTSNIVDRNVTNIKLANTLGSEAVSTGVIRDSAVTTAKLADSSVTSAKIVSGTITTADIADGAITQPLLSAGAVGETNISQYLTTATNSPSAYLPATKIVSAGTTASGQAISTTNKAVDIASVWYENSVGLTSPLLATTLVALTSNRVYLTRVTPSTGRTISHLAFTLAATVATSNDSCDLGIYALNANGTTIDLVASTGATSSRLNAAGFSVQTVALSSSYAMTAGTTYYLAFVSALGGTAAQLPAIYSAHFTINHAMKPTTANTTITQNSLVAYFAHSAATLPTSITMASCGSTASVVSLVARTQA